MERKTVKMATNEITSNFAAPLLKKCDINFNLTKNLIKQKPQFRYKLQRQSK